MFFAKYKLRKTHPEKEVGMTPMKYNKLVGISKQFVMNEFARINQRDLQNAVKLSSSTSTTKDGYRVNVSQQVIEALAKDKVGTVKKKYKFQKEKLQKLKTKYSDLKSYTYHQYPDGKVPGFKQSVLSQLKNQVSRLKQRTIRLKQNVENKREFKGTKPQPTVVDFMDRNPNFIENLSKKFEDKIVVDKFIELYFSKK